MLVPLVLVESAQTGTGGLLVDERPADAGALLLLLADAGAAGCCLLMMGAVANANA